MSGDQADLQILGTLRLSNGVGVVRLEDIFDTDIDDLWSALTKPDRLEHWFSEVDGVISLGHEYREKVFTSGWLGTVRVEEFEPPSRLCQKKTPDGPNAVSIAVEFTLAVDGSQTHLVFEAQGMPLDLLYAYGVGWQIHLESLATYLTGRTQFESAGRWNQLEPAYRAMASMIADS